MKTNIIILVLALFSSLTACANEKKEVKIQIMHNNELVFDTVFYAEPEQARYVIEKCVYNYSKDSIFLNPETIYGLYVFNISSGDDARQFDNTAINNPQNTEPDKKEITVDELYNNQNKTHNNEIVSWDNLTIDMVIDSVSHTLNEIKNQFLETDFANDPDVKEISESVKKIFEKAKSTRIIITTEPDEKSDKK